VDAYGFARRLWTPGTILEEIVGYDLAAGHPVRDAVWRLLRIPRPPGVRLLPQHWQPGSRPSPDRLPTLPVSLILQFKRPEYLASNAAKQYKLWHSPYFRFTRNARQHAVLRQLERRAGNDVVVRYAAPAFHKCAELEAARLRGKVCSMSGYVSPDRLGTHAVWTYRAAGNDGRANPSGTTLKFETLDDLIENLTTRSVSQQLMVGEGREHISTTTGETDRSEMQDLSPYPGPLDELEPLATHVRVLTYALTYRSPSLRNPLMIWRRALEVADLGIGPRALEIIVDIATVQTAMSAIGATWLLYSEA
jgi:hypothetical protein